MTFRFEVAVPVTVDAVSCFGFLIRVFYRFSFSLFLSGSYFVFKEEDDLNQLSWSVDAHFLFQVQYYTVVRLISEVCPVKDPFDAIPHLSVYSHVY